MTLNPDSFSRLALYYSAVLVHVEDIFPPIPLLDMFIFILNQASLMAPSDSGGTRKRKAGGSKKK
jgi:hypothetical protein